jgi:O-antigen ligase
VSPDKNQDPVMLRLRRQVSTGGGKRQTLSVLLEAAVEAGIPAFIVLVTLVFSTQLSDMLVAKRAAIHALVPLLFVLWVVRQSIEGRLRFDAVPYYWPLGLYMVWGAVGLFLLKGADWGQGFEVLVAQGWPLLFFVVVLHHFRDPAAAAGVMWTTVLTGLVVAVVGIAQSGGWQLLPLPARYSNLPISTLGNPNFAAHYLEIIIPLAAAMWIIRRRSWERLLLALIIVLASFHLLLTQSRAGWLGVGAGLVVWGGLYWRRQNFVRYLPLVFLLFLLASPALGAVARGVHMGGGLTLYDRVSQLGEGTWVRLASGFDTDNFSVAQRLIIWSDSVDLIRQQPLLGVGVGHYETALPLYRTPERHQDWYELMGQRRNIAYHAHNEYLEYWAEGGLLALVAMGALFWLLLRTGIRGARSDQKDLRAVSLGCTAGIVATLVHAFFSFNFQDPTASVHFWLLAGLLVAVNRAAAAPSWAVDQPLVTFWKRWLPTGAATGLLVLGVYLTWCIVAGDLSYFVAMNKYRQQGQPNRAVLALRQAVDHKGWDFRYHHTLGLVNLEAGRDAEARAALARSLALHPNNAAALRLAGRAWAAGGAQERATAAAQKAVRLDPYNGGGRLLLGGLYFEGGRYTQALPHIKAALKLRPGDGAAWGYRGALHAVAQEWEQAIGPLRRAVGADPEHRGLWRFLLAESLENVGRGREALIEARLVVVEAPNNQQAVALVRRLEATQAPKE